MHAFPRVCFLSSRYHPDIHITPSAPLSVPGSPPPLYHHIRVLSRSKKCIQQKKNHLYILVSTFWRSHSSQTLSQHGKNNQIPIKLPLTPETQTGSCCLQGRVRTHQRLRRPKRKNSIWKIPKIQTCQLGNVNWTRKGQRNG